jgi:hypothetical protein
MGKLPNLYSASIKHERMVQLIRNVYLSGTFLTNNGNDTIKGKNGVASKHLVVRHGHLLVTTHRLVFIPKENNDKNNVATNKVLIPTVKDKVVEIYVGSIKSLQLNSSQAILSLVTHDLRTFELYLFEKPLSKYNETSNVRYGFYTRAAVNLLADHIFWSLQEDNFYHHDNTALRNRAAETEDETHEETNNSNDTCTFLTGNEIYKEKFSLANEFQRQFKDSPEDLKKWKKSDLNKPIKNRLCDTYPDVLYFPSDVSDDTVRAAAKFRKKNRIPTLTYWSSKTGGLVCRCSQPKAGIGGFRKSKEDIELVKTIAETTRGVDAKNRKEILIIDCRSRLIANTNSVAGGGTEQVGWYKDEGKLTVSTHYCKISNIHAMRKSLKHLASKILDHNHNSVEENESSAVLAAAVDEINLSMNEENDNATNHEKGAEMEGTYEKESFKKNKANGGKRKRKKSVHAKTWIKKMEESSWFAHLKLTIKAGLLGYEKIKKGSAVLVHCSDGWDRTAQVSSLIQIFAEPYYRTVTGFCALVAKDFCAFGHKFRDRGGYGQKIQEESPIFIVRKILSTYMHMLIYNNEL